jgi:hypothetical protein
MLSVLHHNDELSMDPGLRRGDVRDFDQALTCEGLAATDFKPQCHGQRSYRKNFPTFAFSSVTNSGCM